MLLVRALVLVGSLLVTRGPATWPSSAMSSSPQSAINPKNGIGAQPAADVRPPRPAVDENLGGWTNGFPDLAAISAASPNEVWAVGAYGQLLHYIGGTWTAANPPNMLGAATTDIKMLSASSGWVAAGDRAFRYNGTTWTEQSAGLGANLTIARLAGPALDDMWAIGGPADPGDMVHWDGARWHAIPAAVPATVQLTAITMLNDEEGWAVGYDTTNSLAAMLHYDGTAWHQIAAPPGASALYSVGTAAPGDVWARGLDNGAFPLGHFYHYRLGAWVGDQLAGGVPAGVETLLLLSPTDGWATTRGSVYHWDGSTWSADPGISDLLLTGLTAAVGQTWVTGPDALIWHRGTDGAWHRESGKPSHDGLTDVAVLSADDAWAIGSSGTILHFIGGVWTTVPAPPSAELNGLQMLSSDDGYAVGSAILHWDGLRWTQIVTPTQGTSLNAIAMSSSGNGWAVGLGASMWRATAGVWRPVASPVGGDFHAVALDSPSHGWAAGSVYAHSSEAPVLLEWDGISWHDRTPTLPAGTPPLYGLAISPDGASGWAVGHASGALRLRNGTWTLDPDAPPVDHVALEALGEAWAVGCNPASVYHFGGGAWQAQEVPFGQVGACVDSIGLVPGRGGWAVGELGTLLQYQPLAPGQRFYDVLPTQPFASYIDYMAARGIVSGYADNTFRPGNSMTRGQLAKMVVAGLGWAPMVAADPAFADVPPSHPFFSYVETAATHRVISGYTCGGPNEPCDAHSARTSDQPLVSRAGNWRRSSSRPKAGYH